MVEEGGARSVPLILFARRGRSVFRHVAVVDLRSAPSACEKPLLFSGPALEIRAKSHLRDETLPNRVLGTLFA